MTGVKARETLLPGVLVLESPVFADERGLLFESYNRRHFAAATGFEAPFVQENRSRSRLNVLRGLHYQLGHPQGKLVQVLRGEIFDVAVDVRRSSSQFGRWTGLRLAADEPRALWIPPGFAHGFLALSEGAEVLYKLTALRDASSERTLVWNDPAIGIRWPLEGQPLLSARDAAAPALAAADVFA